MAKIAKYIGFSLYRRSYLIWSRVLVVVLLLLYLLMTRSNPTAVLTPRVKTHSPGRISKLVVSTMEKVYTPSDVSMEYISPRPFQSHHLRCASRVPPLTLLGLQSRFGDSLLKFPVICPRNGTAVLNGLRHGVEKLGSRIRPTRCRGMLSCVLSGTTYLVLVCTRYNGAAYVDHDTPLLPCTPPDARRRLTRRVNESFTLTFRGHSNHGYNVYGHGENRFGKNEIVGTVTQSGKMEIFKVWLFIFICLMRYLFRLLCVYKYWFLNYIISCLFVYSILLTCLFS